MQLDVSKFAKAAALGMGIVYLICAAFVYLWPEFSLQSFGWLVHLVNVDKFAGDVAVTFGGFVAGLIQAVVYSYLGGWLFASLYNRL
ncbi:MAG: hypothetical protein HZB99_02335 [Candidatus Harrisonbacteria bacterium]|nr:hypothetical protein [Candidatus Harrisonbacteria bacterium]